MGKTRTVRRKGSGGGLTNTTLLQWVREWNSADQSAKAFSKRANEVKGRLKDVVLAQGYKDDKGHLLLELPEKVEDIETLQAQRREGTSLDEEAAFELLKRKKLTKQCTRTITVIDEEELVKAHFQGLITEEELDSVRVKKVSYAFVPIRS